MRARARVTRSAGSRPDAHRVDEAVVRVGRVEDRLAADGRDADAVAVVADARDRALEVPVRLAEAQAVEERDRPRAHRDDVAQDPADAGGRALERLDRGRVVVALDLERDRLALAEVDHAGVLARALQHALARGREAAQQAAPSACSRSAPTRAARRRRARSGSGRAQQLADPLELPVSEPERPMERLFDDLRQRERSLVAGVTPKSLGEGSALALPVCSLGESDALVPVSASRSAGSGVRHSSSSRRPRTGLEPTTIMAGRLLLAAALLVPVLIASTGLRRSTAGSAPPVADRARLGHRQRGASLHADRLGREAHRLGDAAIANASMPIFVVLLALRVRKSESARGSRLAGVLLGLRRRRSARRREPARRVVGVAGTHGGRRRGVLLRGRRACTRQHHIEAVPVLVFSTAQSVAGAVVLLPFGIAQLPVGGCRAGRRSRQSSPSGSPARRSGRSLYYRLRQPARLGAREPRRLPAAAVRAPVRGDPPGRVAEPAEAGRARPDPRRRRSRFGSRRRAPAGRRRCRNERPHSPRDGAGDVDFLLELVNHEDVEPFMSVRPRARSRNAARGDRALRTGAARERPVRDRGSGRRRVDARGRDGLRRREPAQQDRQSRRPGDAPGFPRPPDRRRGGAAACNGICSTTSASTGCSSSATASTSVPFVTRSVPVSCGRA